MTLEIVTVPCRSDNYAYLLRDTSTGAVGLVDAPEAAPIEAALDARGWGLDTILITHHHDDHVAGVAQLQAKYGAKVVGAAADRHRLPALDLELAEGDTVAIGESRATVMEVPGHTVGHIAYHFAEDHALFSADSLMVMGCGRLFEGSAAQMWDSLSRMAALPDSTDVFSGHEYTEFEYALRALCRRGQSRPARKGGPDRRDAPGRAADSARETRPREGDEPLPARRRARSEGPPRDGAGR